MNAAEGPQQVMTGEVRAVDVAEIEHALTGLWMSAAGADGDAPIVRASALTLVAYVTDPRSADRIAEVIAQASRRHPNRSIVIVNEPRHSLEGPEATISARCQVPHAGGKQVCSEQITLRASGPVLDELHGTVLPLLVSDMPVFLWWQGLPDLGSHLFGQLLANCDRLIVDSDQFPSQRAAAALAGIHRLAREEAVSATDINWSRLTAWRELIAQFFDAPPARGYVARLDGVTVQIASERAPANLTEGLLLVGWLASRLGWTFEDGSERTGEEGVRFTLRSGRTPVAVHLQPAANHPRDDLHSVRLRASDGASFQVTRKADDRSCVVVAVEMPDGTGHSRVVHMDEPSEEALLCGELDLLEHDPVFEQALEQAVLYVSALG
ncbi:MAG: glucose-6-phosphate dehydrogenase assembly protein OpcA [Dehalococcoidia bacterium]